MDEAKVEEALTKWLDDESEHDAADFGARFNSDHPGYDMTEMAMGFYAGYVAASKQTEPVAPEPSCLLCTEYDSCRYQGPEVCGDFVRKIPAPVQSAMSEENIEENPLWLAGYKAGLDHYLPDRISLSKGIIRLAKWRDLCLDKIDALRAQLAERAEEKAQRAADKYCDLMDESGHACSSECACWHRPTGGCEDAQDIYRAALGGKEVQQ